MTKLLDTQEVCRKGQAVYEGQLKARLEPMRQGEYVAIEIETADFLVAETGSDALANLRQKHPDGVFYLARIGYAAADFHRGFK